MWSNVILANGVAADPHVFSEYLWLRGHKVEAYDTSFEDGDLNLRHVAEIADICEGNRDTSTLHKLMRIITSGGFTSWAADSMQDIMAKNIIFESGDGKAKDTVTFWYNGESPRVEEVPWSRYLDMVREYVKKYGK